MTTPVGLAPLKGGLSAQPTGGCSPLLRLGLITPCKGAKEPQAAPSLPLWIRAPGKQSSGLFSARMGRQAPEKVARPIEDGP